MTDLRVHYAVRIFRAVRYLGESVWQPLCLQSDSSRIKMSTELEEITCIRCQDTLIKQSRKLGITKQVNETIRGGKWNE